MPQIWSEQEKTKMRESSTYHMSDAGYRLVRSITTNSIGESTESWIQASSPIDCGIEMHEGKEIKSDITTTTYDVTLRVPHNTDITEVDRFRVTKFRGDTVNIDFEITTPKQWGISACLFGMRRIVL